MPFRFFTLFLAVAATTFTSAATWTLTTADFNKSVVAVTSFDDHNLRGTSQDAAVTVPIQSVLRLSRDAKPVPAGAYTVYLTNGDRIGGDVGDLKDDVLAFTSPVLGKLTLPVDNLRGFSRGTVVPNFAEERKEDELTLANRDVVRGVVSGIEGRKVLMQINGDTSGISLDSVDSLLFASAPKPKAEKGSSFRVQFIDNSQVTAASVSLAGSKLTMKLANGNVHETDEANVLSIEQVNGPVQWLSDLQPTISEQSSFNSEAGFPARWDRSVFGKPLRVGGEIYERGIGVHANSRLVYSLDGTFKAFRTRCGIDGNGDAAKADVNVRVLLDDKPVYEKQHFRSADEALVLANLGGAKTLTLEVTAGGPTDAQDRFDWAEAALLREVPAAPSTQPATAPVK